MASRRTFNWVLNTISVLCATFVIWQVARNYFLSSTRSSGFVDQVGSNVKLAGASWSTSPKTVVLALSTQCHFCKVSAGFYRTLVGSARPERFRVVAAVRESAQELRPHLAELGIESVQTVGEVDFATLGVEVTPTVLVVDRGGTVQAAWRGKLTPSQEREVFAAVQTEMPRQLKGSPSSGAPVIPVRAAELLTLLKSPHTILLDIRERPRFYEAHITGALNMPLDEFVPRGPHELPQDDAILLYCIEYSSGGCSSQARFTTWGCEEAIRGLDYVGMTQVRPIADDLATLAAKGIPVEGKPCREARHN